MLLTRVRVSPGWSEQRAAVALVDRGVLTVDISERHTLDDLATLHRRSEAGDLRGKVIVRPASTGY